MAIENAKITNAFLGFEDHGMLTVYLTLSMDGFTAGWGGMVLSNSNGFTPLFGKYISDILKTVGVSEWKDLIGKYVRAEENGIASPVTKIGNIIEDKWIDNATFFKGNDKFYETEVEK